MDKQVRKPEPLLRIESYEHVGIRVTDRDRAVRFYERLGFQLEEEYPDSPSKAIEMINDRGVRINLICNAAPREGAFNILQDNDTKLPGITHIAFAVADIEAVIRALAAANIPLTDDRKSLPRRDYIFFRDPDGNVIEINEYSRGRQSLPQC